MFQTTPSIKDGQAILKVKEDVVSFNKIRFSYDDKKKVITDLSFNVKPGQKMTLVEETDDGKSTILKLLFRFYDVTQGFISIDDQDIQTITVTSLRESIEVVSQDPDLFNDTILKNVRYFRLDATDDEVILACKVAAVHEKIMIFTNEYATKVDENKIKLSDDELQRVAIARAILKNPKIMLLDEATSSVDTDTEVTIQQALDKLIEGRTTFIVAHRLSTVMNADLMLIIKNDEIVKQESSKELLKAKNKYYDLWSKQNGIVSTPAEDVSNLLKESSTTTETQSIESFTLVFIVSSDDSLIALTTGTTLTKWARESRSELGSVRIGFLNDFSATKFSISFLDSWMLILLS